MRKVNGRCSQIASSATIARPCDGVDRPVERRQAERAEQPASTMPDVGIEHVLHITTAPTSLIA